MNDAITIQEHVNTVTKQVGKQLQLSLNVLEGAPSKLIEAMEYSLTAGGKRIRPYLVLASAYAIHGEVESYEKAYGAACAIEYIHTYSLIHDDLPAMDNDDFRRGKPTNHKVFGEGMAILAGDALLTQSFGFVTDMAKKGYISAAVAIDIIDDLVKYAGAKGMVGGQVADILGEQGITSITQLEYIHEHKTSDLIVCSVLAGARTAGASADQLVKLELYGRNIGLAFQIQDDILDLIGDTEKLGKPVLSDVEQQKVTYPYLIGLDESIALVQQLTEQAKQAIIEANLQEPQQLIEIADYLVHRES